MTTNQIKPLLAKNYIDRYGKTTLKDPTGWFLSEKFDGYRAIWNGKQFMSRTNKEFMVPDWFRDLMPKGIALDGEFWIGRGEFAACGIFRKKNPDSDEWRKVKVKYMAFDLPLDKSPFEERMKKLKQIVAKIGSPKHVAFAKQKKIKSKKHLDSMFDEVVARGGEGVMLRQPGSMYEGKRSKTLLKYKQFHDTEVKVTGYFPGKGKYEGKLGSFICELVTDPTIKVKVSGVDDEIRNDYKITHPIGTIITIGFSEKTSKGVPRFPVYIRKRFIV